MSGYSEGAPCWVDLASTDLDRAIEFYAGFFGWEAERAPEPEARGYTMFKLRGKSVAGGGPAWEGMPSVWQTYIWTEDADACCARIREAGGEVVMEPFDVLDAGRMAVVKDPTGAHFSLWQPAGHRGAEVTHEPGSQHWNECQTLDPDTAQAFYVSVFGYDVEVMPDMNYRLFKLAGQPVAGLIQILPEWGEVPPNWSTVFAVSDTDEAVARAESLGGGLLNGPRDIPVGRFAVLHDPTGAVFQVITPAQAPPG